MAKEESNYANVGEFFRWRWSAIVGLNLFKTASFPSRSSIATINSEAASLLSCNCSLVEVKNYEQFPSWKVEDKGSCLCSNYGIYNCTRRNPLTLLGAFGRTRSGRVECKVKPTFV